MNFLNNNIFVNIQSPLKSDADFIERISASEDNLTFYSIIKLSSQLQVFKTTLYMFKQRLCEVKMYGSDEASLLTSYPEIVATYSTLLDVIFISIGRLQIAIQAFISQKRSASSVYFLHTLPKSQFL